MTQVAKYKLGADPETFLKLGPNFISAHDIVPGTKDEPFKVDKGAFQRDGLAFEFNIDPAESPEEFSNNIEVVLTQMKEHLRKIDKDIEIVFIPFANFSAKYFEDLPLEPKILGCDPDYSCLTGQIIEKTHDITHRPFRTAAGHIHIGWTEGENPTGNPHFQDARFIANHFYNFPVRVKSLDRNQTSEERQRLAYYGMAGAFRPKSYGVELREFSNVWVEKKEDREKMFRFITKEMEKLG